MSKSKRQRQGFSLLELMVAVFVFILLAGAAFSLLSRSQQRYRAEGELTESFQAARTAMDQIARDIHTAGYPPISQLPCALAAANPALVAYPFAWTPNYVAPTCPPPAPPAGCTVGTTCTVPGNFDLIIETRVNGVQWVRYQLNGTTLFRGVAPKVAGTDPAVATAGVLLPYVENVMNNAPAATITQIRNSYPGMFPGGNPVPIFTYTFDSVSTPQVPQNIREVNIRLIVAAAELDPLTRQPRVATLTALARRMNPN